MRAVTSYETGADFEGHSQCRVFRRRSAKIIGDGRPLTDKPWQFGSEPFTTGGLTDSVSQRWFGGLIDLAHTPLADEGGDVVVGETGADFEGHSQCRVFRRRSAKIIGDGRPLTDKPWQFGSEPFTTVR